jgi:hypothetical protein
LIRLMSIESVNRKFSPKPPSIRGLFLFLQLAQANYRNLMSNLSSPPHFGKSAYFWEERLGIGKVPAFESFLRLIKDKGHHP